MECGVCGGECVPHHGLASFCVRPFAHIRDGDIHTLARLAGVPGFRYVTSSTRPDPPTCPYPPSYPTYLSAPQTPTVSSFRTPPLLMTLSYAVLAYVTTSVPPQMQTTAFFLTDLLLQYWYNALRFLTQHDLI